MSADRRRGSHHHAASPVAEPTCEAPGGSPPPGRDPAPAGPSLPAHSDLTIAEPLRGRRSPCRRHTAARSPRRRVLCAAAQGTGLSRERDVVTIPGRSVRSGRVAAVGTHQWLCQCRGPRCAGCLRRRPMRRSGLKCRARLVICLPGDIVIASWPSYPAPEPP
mgnify:CR=1 FL=1